MKASIRPPIARSGSRPLPRRCGPWVSRASPLPEAGTAHLASVAAEIRRDQFRVVDQRVRRTGLDDLAGFQHVAVIRGLQRGAGVLLDEQDRYAEAPQR